MRCRWVVWRRLGDFLRLMSLKTVESAPLQYMVMRLSFFSITFQRVRGLGVGFLGVGVLGVGVLGVGVLGVGFLGVLGVWFLGFFCLLIFWGFCFFSQFFSDYFLEV